MSKPVEKFIYGLEKSLSASTFVKLTLSNYKGANEHLQKVFARLVETKKGTRLFVQCRYDTQDTVKNFDFSEGVEIIKNNLKSGFRSGHLFTTESDFQLDLGKKNARLITGKPTFKTKSTTPHDREKKHLIDPSAYYLKALGITTDDGKIRADGRDKWKQINKFVEILGGLYERSSLKDKSTLRILDMGSGKGYLTFAAYDYFSNKLAGAASILLTKVSMTGIEQRPELVALCNDIAQAGGFDGLNFVQGSIADFEPGKIDILIALHACDTATDDALYKGITADASIIVAAPCCHHEIKKQMKSPELLAGILKHPVLLERTAEIITDGIRSMLLEANGYAAKMFEFVATEHTPKNNMLVAIKQNRIRNVSEIERQITDIRISFGIGYQHLADLLA